MIDEQQANELLGKAQGQLENFDDVVKQLNDSDHTTQQEILSQLQQHLGATVPKEVTPEVQAQRDALPPMLSADQVDSNTFDSTDPFDKEVRQANPRTGVIAPKPINARKLMGEALASLSKFSEVARTPIAAVKAALTTPTNSTYGYGSNQTEVEGKSFTENFNKFKDDYEKGAKEVEDANTIGTMIGDGVMFVMTGAALKSAAASVKALPEVAPLISKVTSIFPEVVKASKTAKVVSSGLAAGAEVAGVNAVKQLSPDVEDKNLKQQFAEAGIVAAVTSAIPGAFYAHQLFREGKAAVASLRGMEASQSAEVNTVIDLIKTSGGYKKAKDAGEAAVKYLQDLSGSLEKSIGGAIQKGQQAVQQGAVENPAIREVAVQTGKTLQAIQQAAETKSKDAAAIVIGGQASLNKFYGTVEAKASSEYGRAMGQIQEHMGVTPVGKIDDIVDAYISKAIAEEKIVKNASGNLEIAIGENAMSKAEFDVLKQLDKVRKPKSVKVESDLESDETFQELLNSFKPGNPGITTEVVEGSSVKAAVYRNEQGKPVAYRSYHKPAKGEVGIEGSESVYVAKEERRKGIATALTDHVEKTDLPNIRQLILEAPKTPEGAALASSLLSKSELTAEQLNQLKRNLGGAVKDWTPGTSGHDTWQNLKSRITDSLVKQDKTDVAQQFIKMSSDYAQVKGLLGETRKITRLGKDFLENPLAKGTKVNTQKVSSALENLSSEEAILKMDFAPLHVEQLTTSMKALETISDAKAVNRLVTNKNSFTKKLSSISAKREENLAQGLDEYALLNPAEKETLKVLQKTVQDTGKLLDEYRVASNIKGMPKVLNDALKNPKDKATVESAIKLARSNMDSRSFATYRDALESQRKRFVALDGKPGKKSFQQVMKIMDDPEVPQEVKQEIAYMSFGDQGDKFVSAVSTGKAYEALLKMEKLTGGDPTTQILAPEIKQAFEGGASGVLIRGTLASMHPWTIIAEQFIKAIKNPQKAIYLAKTGLFSESEIKGMQAYYNFAKSTLKANKVTPVIGNAAMSQQGDVNGQ